MSIVDASVEDLYVVMPKNVAYYPLTVREFQDDRESWAPTTRNVRRSSRPRSSMFLAGITLCSTLYLSF